MGWFKKKGSKQEISERDADELEAPRPGDDPALPKLPEMPKLPKLKELPKLPSKRELEQQMQKPATAVPGLPPQRAAPPSMPDMEPSIMGAQAPPIEQLAKTPTGPITSPPTATLPKTKEPIFVKIDKFKDAVQSFEHVKSKVEDIEKMLHEIKLIKAKEEQELQQWENEVRVIKSRVENIDESLFKEMER